MTMLRKLAATFTSMLLLAGIAGCSADTSSITDTASSAYSQNADKLKDAANGALEDLKNQLDNASPSANATATPNTGDTGEWSMSAAPDYYKVTGKADFTDVTIPAAGKIEYAQPDNLNRPGTAIGVITKQLRDNGSSRDRDMPDTITGWPTKNPKVTIDLGNGKTYRGYLFNKSHLIAKSLGGEDIPENMITGTRTQNVGKNQPAGGMAYTETQARDWLDNNPTGTITYKATPHYTGDELVPRTVTVDMKTSDGTIDEHVITYNTANGFDINYDIGGVK